MFLFAFVSLLFTGAIAITCNLSDAEKFSTECQNIVTAQPNIIYLNQNFTLEIESVDIQVVNISLFANSNDYCDANSFADGVQCIFSVTKDFLLSQTNIESKCLLDDTSTITDGNVNIIIGLTNCAINLPGTLQQSTSIEISNVDVSDTHYIANSIDSIVNVNCKGIPQGANPILSFMTFNVNETADYQSYNNSNGTIVAEFMSGIKSGVLSCVSAASGYASVTYITLVEDLPIAYYPLGRNQSVIVGDSLNISVVVLTNSMIDLNSVSFMPVQNVTDKNNPMIVSVDNIHYNIVYDHIGIVPTNSYQLCFTTLNDGGSGLGSGLGEEVNNIMMGIECTDPFYLYVKETSVQLSANLNAYYFEDFDNGLVNISCLPEDLTATVFWQLSDSTPLSEAYPDYIFSPPGLNHTVTIVSPPVGIAVFSCGLYNYGELVLLNEKTTTVVALSNPVSLWNNNNEILDGSIINLFDQNPDNENLLSLRCFSTIDNDELYWLTNVSALPNELTPFNEINGLTLSPGDRDTTLTYTIIDSQRTGYYTCASDVTDNTVTVFVTLDDPYWKVISSSSIEPPVGTNQSIIIQYAYNSQGYGNSGVNLSISLEIQPFLDSEPYLQFQNMISDPNQYFYNYTFTAAKSDRGTFVFQALRNEITVFSNVDVYSIVPTFTSLSTPVYGRLGRVVNLSCTANETSAPIIWGISDYEQFHTINNEPGFSFTPPIINEQMSFNISTNTLDNGQNYYYDVDSGSYSQIQFACGFQDGYIEGLSDYSEIILEIRNYDILLENVYQFQTIKNNSIVNVFSQNQENSFQSRCTTTQGNHDTFWSVELFSDGLLFGEPVVINSSYSNLLYSITNNQYVSKLNTLVTEDTSGRYLCSSSITGIFETFILTYENPFIMVRSQTEVNAFLGESIIMTFLAAVDSDGNTNSMSAVEVIHTDVSQSTNVLEAEQKCISDEASNCYEYELSIVALPNTAGSYTGRISAGCLISENGTEVCTYAEDSVNITVEVPNLLPSHSEQTVYIGQPLELSCTPSKGDFVISWQHNGITIPGIPIDSKRNAILSSILSPFPYNYDLFLPSSLVDDAGIYTCSLLVQDEVILAHSINVTISEVPSVTASTDLTANLINEFEEGLVSITCLPSDDSAIITWELQDGTHLLDMYPDVTLTPANLNHTVTFTSAPTGINRFICGLYNNGGFILNANMITVVALSSSISIWNNNQELSPNAVINTFNSHFEDNLPFLSLRCFSTQGNGLLYWKTENVTSLPTLINANSQINNLSVIETDRDITLNYARINEQKIGYYICSSNATQIESIVLVTLDNPYWSIVSQTNLEPPIGINVSIVFQYAYNSQGYGNNGADLQLSLEVEPALEGKSYYRFQEATLNSKQYLYNYTFTVGKSDRGQFIFEAAYGEIILNSYVAIYSIVPTFTSLSTPVYGRLGRVVNLSCTANETSAPIIWGISDYEQFHTINNEPGFSFTPPIINEQISFNISTNTLDNAQNYYYDVDSGSYSQIQFACGFQDGYIEGLSDYSEIILEIRNYDINCVDEYHQSLLNNSIINYNENDYYSENAELDYMMQITCTSVQGDDSPMWKAEFFGTPNFPGVISNEYSELLYTNQVNSYVTELIIDLTEDISGNYRCESAISGIFLNFILTSENPFLKAAKSENNVTGLLGEQINISFYAALDSTGYSCANVPMLEVIHTSPSGVNETLFAQRVCEYDCSCFEYVLLIDDFTSMDVGSYTGRLGRCMEEIGCIYATDTIVLSIKAPDLLPSHTTVEAYIGDPIQLSCSPSYDNVPLAIDVLYEISWLHNGMEITDQACQEEEHMDLEESCLFPQPYNTSLVIVTTSVNDSGIYTCSLIIEDELIIMSTIITVSVIPRQLNCFVDESCGEFVSITESITECCQGYTARGYVNDNDECTPCPIIQCPLESSSGILWDNTNAGSYASVSCDNIGRQFSPLNVITRECLSSGYWSTFDFTNCTLKSDVTSFATVSIVLNSDEIEDAVSDLNNLLENLRAIMDSFNLTYTGVSVTSIVEEIATINFEIEFDILSDEDVSILVEIQSSLVSSDTFGQFTTESSELYALRVADSCPCAITSLNSQIGLITKCSSTSAINPCQCQDNNCQCQSPYVGDGVLCTFDTDGDSYPDVPLDNCNSDNNDQTYCKMDNCETVFNPDQNPDACKTIAGFTGCNFVTDSIWGIEWANIAAGQTDIQPCPPGTTGMATRICNLESQWEESNVINCLPEVYQNLLDEADAISSSTADIQTRVSQVVALTQELAIASNETTRNAESLLPASINSTNQILRTVLGVLFESLASVHIGTHVTDGLQIANIINNLLEENQMNGWDALQTQNTDILGSDILLLNIEEYGLYLGLSRNDTVIRMSNIAIRAKQYSLNTEGTLSFPQPGDLDGTDFPSQAAAVSIPSEALAQRVNENGMVSVISTLCLNMERILEAIDRNDNNRSRPASLVWSGQISANQDVVSRPINLTFRVDTNNTNSSYLYRCVFWNETEKGFSSDGITTLGSHIDDYGNTVVDCQSNHLTPFAVLVDVAGSIQHGSTEYKALQVVSYIGCAISLVCLFVTIVFFLSFGKKLLTSVHFFIHLNLAISLFCAYLVFVVGVETARSSQIGCGFVAAILQYFFLSSFCWMLCEGIMLYLMLVVVFSTLSKRWYIFLAIGWAPPLLPVIIGLAAGYNQYGVRNEEGDLLFCWLSTRKGVIWAFVAPMIVIVLINVFFLIMALRSVWKTSKGKIHQSNQHTRNLVVSLLKATLILLPLLGLTWLFGLLSVDQNTSVFAWIFTLLNTAQGIAIFFFHVVRSDRVWSKISPYLNRIQGKISKTKTSEFSSTINTSSSTVGRGSTLKSYAFKNAGYKANTFKKTTSEISLGIAEYPEFELAETNNDTKKLPLASIDEEEADRIRIKESEIAQLNMNDSTVIENEMNV